MRLTRRDALVALGAGVGAGALRNVSLARSEGDDSTDGAEIDDAVLESLVATAEVVYPDAVSESEAFVREYIGGLPADSQRTIASVTKTLDDHSRRERGRAFASLSEASRDEVLRSLGVDRSGSDADGQVPDRIRYHVVNQVLYGLYTSPKGSRLVGITNPIGHPGGHQSYQRPPEGTDAKTTNRLDGGTDE